MNSNMAFYLKVFLVFPTDLLLRNLEMLNTGQLLFLKMK